MKLSFRAWAYAPGNEAHISCEPGLCQLTVDYEETTKRWVLRFRWTWADLELYAGDADLAELKQKIGGTNGKDHKA
jgi:hypothetical protein